MSANSPACPASIDETAQMLEQTGYFSDRPLATLIYLALKLRRPLFLEGEAGVGKTEIAHALGRALKRRIIRLQCYEGLDIASAVYEWNYAAQMIEIRLAEAAGSADRAQLSQSVFSRKFLIARPILQALMPSPGGAPVFLIDELDRADEAFEAFLLEMLAENQVTIPEIGKISAGVPPIIVITSNRTREIHDALKRRCLYHWVDYPDPARELQILHHKVPDAAPQLSAQIINFVQKLRDDRQIFKRPGIAETIDWATALCELDQIALDLESVSDTLGVLLKYQDDIARLRNGEVARLLEEARAGAASGPARPASESPNPA